MTARDCTAHALDMCPLVESGSDWLSERRRLSLAARCELPPVTEGRGGFDPVSHGDERTASTALSAAPFSFPAGGLRFGVHTQAGAR